MGDFTKAEVLVDVGLIVGGFPVFTGENSLAEEQLSLSVDQAVTTYSIELPRYVSNAVYVPFHLSP